MNKTITLTERQAEVLSNLIVDTLEAMDNFDDVPEEYTTQLNIILELIETA